LASPEQRATGVAKARMKRTVFTMDIPNSDVRIVFHQSAMEKLRSRVLETAGAVLENDVEAVLLGWERLKNDQPALEIVDVDFVESEREPGDVPARSRELRLLQCAGGRRPNRIKCLGFARSRSDGPLEFDQLHAGLARGALAVPAYILMALQAATAESVVGAMSLRFADASVAEAEAAIDFEFGPARIKVLPQSAGPVRIAGPQKWQEPAEYVEPLRPENPEQRRVARFGWEWPAAGLVAGLLILAVLTYFPQRRAVVSAPAYVEALTVDRDGAEIRLQWNRSSPLFHGAKSALLVIKDGRERTIVLDLRLERGILLYTMKSAEADFQLLIYGRTQRTESVHVMREGDRLETARAATAEGAMPELPSAGEIASPSAPAVAELPTPTPPRVRAADVGKAVEAPPVVPRAEGDKPAAPVVKRPEPVRRVLPTIPRGLDWARQAGATVTIMVDIDASGKVLSSRVSECSQKGKPFQKVALDAARRWEFAPATINGKAVPAQNAIAFNFAPDPSAPR
jgi:TonB family protein